MDTRALKIQINAATAATRQQRLEATNLIVSGRKLRRGGRALGATKPDPDLKGLALLKQGWERHRKGMSLLGAAESGRYDRRHMHLTAALLNCRTYQRCESSTNPHTPSASVSKIVTFLQTIAPHYEGGLQQDALNLAREWLDRGDVRLRYLHDEGKFVLRTYDEVPARFPGKGVHNKKSEAA